MEGVLNLFGWSLFGVLFAVLAYLKGRSALHWFFLGLLAIGTAIGLHVFIGYRWSEQIGPWIPLLGMLILVFLPSKKKRDAWKDAILRRRWERQNADR